MAEPGQGAQVAAQTLFTASAAANAIPIAGQFVSAGLALAGLFTKIFGGRRRKKKAEAERKKQEKLSTAANLVQATQGGAGGVGIAGSQQSQITTSAVTTPQATSFSSFGGGPAPSVQPTQQALNNTLGFK